MKVTSQVLSGAVVALLGATGANAALPQVDLGYEIHEAARYNETSGLYYFTNSRYGQAPVGELRFKAPLAPTGRNPDVQLGKEPRACPQGTPSWGVASSEFGERWLRGNLEGFNYTQAHAAELPVLKAVSGLLLQTPGLSEDCLFLDVVVSKKAFDGGKKKKVPVFVWLPGGGYVYGTKDNYATAGDPTGLLAAAQRDGSDGFVFVSINYRLGAFGWLAGPSLEAAGGIANAGLHDQNLALAWVQKNIQLFGGDAKQVTVGGLSAGGGSILHHITAEGGKKAPAFKRAFLNSPGYLPIVTSAKAENITQTFLSYLNVATIEEARQLPTEKLIQANADHILSSTTDYVFGPAVDGQYVPDTPDKLLLAGRYNKKVEVLLSHETYEGGTYVAPYVVTDADFLAYLQIIQPDMSAAEKKRVLELYPGGAERTIFFTGDFVFACQTDYVARALKDKAYLYEYNVTSPFHGNDLAWTFNGAIPASYGNAPIKPQVDYLQEYITNFVKKGDPNGAGLPKFPQYGKNASSQFISSTGVTTGRATHNNEKCRWFQEKLYA